MRSRPVLPVPVVRSPRWPLPDHLTEVLPGVDLEEECSRVAFSLTLPHLEPFLVRTFRGVVDDLGATRLADEVRAFCAQEARHHREHARFNRWIREQLGPTTAERLVAEERRLAADYDRFSATRSARANVAYAEGFEAMTCAMALTRLAVADPASGTRPAGADVAPGSRPGPWLRLWAWHLAEEVEHRTVAFDLAHHLGVRWPGRVTSSLRAQAHFLAAHHRLHRVLLAHHGVDRRVPYLPDMLRRGWRRYAATFGPGYDPARLEVPPTVAAPLEAVPGS